MAEARKRRPSEHLWPIKLESLLLFLFLLVLSPSNRTISYSFIAYHSLPSFKARRVANFHRTNLPSPPPATDARDLLGKHLRPTNPEHSHSYRILFQSPVANPFYLLFNTHYVTTLCTYTLHSFSKCIRFYCNIRMQRELNSHPSNNNFFHQPSSILRRFSASSIFNSSRKVIAGLDDRSSCSQVNLYNCIDFSSWNKGESLELPAVKALLRAGLKPDANATQATALSTARQSKLLYMSAK